MTQIDLILSYFYFYCLLWFEIPLFVCFHEWLLAGYLATTGIRGSRGAMAMATGVCEINAHLRSRRHTVDGITQTTTGVIVILGGDRPPRTP